MRITLFLRCKASNKCPYHPVASKFGGGVPRVLRESTNDFTTPAVALRLLFLSVSPSPSTGRGFFDHSLLLDTRCIGLGPRVQVARAGAPAADVNEVGLCLINLCLGDERSL
jgi:hypothetical protein